MALLSKLNRRDTLIVGTSALSLGLWAYNVLRKRDDRLVTDLSISIEA